MEAQRSQRSRVETPWPLKASDFDHFKHSYFLLPLDSLFTASCRVTFPWNVYEDMVTETARVSRETHTLLVGETRQNAASLGNDVV